MMVINGMTQIQTSWIHVKPSTVTWRVTMIPSCFLTHLKGKRSLVKATGTSIMLGSRRSIRKCVVAAKINTIRFVLWTIVKRLWPWPLSMTLWTTTSWPIVDRAMVSINQMISLLPMSMCLWCLPFMAEIPARVLLVPCPSSIIPLDFGVIMVMRKASLVMRLTSINKKPKQPVRAL